MGKHSQKQNNTVLRNTAALTVAGLGGAAAFAGTAGAATVVVPGTTMTFEVAGLENASQDLAKIPGIEQWVPEVAAKYNADVNGAPVVSEQAAPVKTDGERVLEAAQSKIGSPYRWGAAGPNAFDCSGLTSWAYSQVGKHIPRTSYAQAAQGTPVAFKDLQAGDIIAFYSGASHVGIYTGHGTVVHAINESKPLSETSLEYMPFHSAVRF